MRLAFSLLLLLVCADVWAACSDCSTSSASCDASSNSSQVSTCIGSMPDQGTLTFGAGTYTFGVRLDARNGITVICETAPLSKGAATTNPCTFSASPAFSWDSTSGHATNLIRISGFRFSHATGPAVTFGRTYDNGWIDKFRIDHNTFLGADGIATGHGANPSGYQIFGVIDNNLFDAAQGNYPLQILGADDSDWTSKLLGTGDAIFFEDNEFAYTDEPIGSCLDTWRGGRIIARYNSGDNCRLSTHGICHNGPAVFEAYNNTMTNNGYLDGYRAIHHQGSGEFVAFNNAITGTSGSLEVQHYRSDDNAEASSCTSAGIQAKCDGTWGSDGNRVGGNGYPCFRQPGRDVDATMRPLYMWNNTINGTRTLTDINDSGTGVSRLADHMQSDRDYYDSTNAQQSSASSPFNGTTGVGWGTLANRPTTCTTNATAGDSAGCAGNGCGVGYWATDGGTNWNKSNVGTEDGGLYICKDTNTWELYYTPYTYPHPLRNESGGGTSGRFVIILADFAPIIIGLGLLGGLYAHRSAWNHWSARAIRARMGEGRDQAPTRAV